MINVLIRLHNIILNILHQTLRKTDTNWDTWNIKANLTLQWNLLFLSIAKKKMVKLFITVLTKSKYFLLKQYSMYNKIGIINLTKKDKVSYFVFLQTNFIQFLSSFVQIFFVFENMLLQFLYLVKVNQLNNAN